MYNIPLNGTITGLYAVTDEDLGRVYWPPVPALDVTAMALVQVADGLSGLQALADCGRFRSLVYALAKVFSLGWKGIKNKGLTNKSSRFEAALTLMARARRSQKFDRHLIHLIQDKKK